MGCCGFDVFEQFAVERMPCQGCGVAQNDEFHACPGDGDIHAPQVAEETDLSVVIGADKGDDDDEAA